jgi:hypothetical protein
MEGRQAFALMPCLLATYLDGQMSARVVHAQVQLPNRRLPGIQTDNLELGGRLVNPKLGDPEMIDIGALAGGGGRQRQKTSIEPFPCFVSYQPLAKVPAG